MDLNELEALLHSRLQHDEWYQMLKSRCAEAETDYIRIRSTLNTADQEALEHYISLCEEMEYRRSCLALELRK